MANEGEVGRAKQVGMLVRVSRGDEQSGGMCTVHVV